jgi:hypothetical protein
MILRAWSTARTVDGAARLEGRVGEGGDWRVA